jgi:hypothetical protein
VQEALFEKQEQEEKLQLQLVREEQQVDAQVSSLPCLSVPV